MDRIRSIQLGVCLVFALGIMPSAKAETVLDTWVEKMQVAYDNAYDEQCDPALDTLKAGAASTEYKGISPAGKAMIQRAILVCAIETGDKDLARQTFLRWRKDGPSKDLLWSYRWEAAQEADWEDADRALKAYEYLAENDTSDWNDWDNHLSWKLLRTIKKAHDGEAEATRILRLYYLQDVHGYKDDDPLTDISFRAFAQADAFLTLGETEKAKALAVDITAPEIIIRILTVHRLAPLRQAEWATDTDTLLGLYETERDRTEEALEASPEKLRAWIAHADVLRSLGEDEAAITLLDDALSQTTGSMNAFTDYKDQINWVLNEKAYAQIALGRMEEGINTFRHAIKTGESGNPNVSQIINLSASLKYAGRFDEAIAVLEAIGDASDFGKMFDASIRACAAFELGDLTTAQTHLDYVIAHKDDNISALQETYACMQMDDAAAALLIERLGDLDQADNALQSMHRVKPSRVPKPHHARVKDAMQRVFDRPDVQAAAAKVGIIIDLPIYDTYWGDL